MAGFTEASSNAAVNGGNGSNLAAALDSGNNETGERAEDPEREGKDAQTGATTIA